ncbi:hypothetical protein F5Y15DRAFT_417317 [Xylariaceae sp. FL0016]|nr:hypothetical protein F5Y15DRAFT_417317 [Xylariaceae sp. FL0016]
MHRKSKAVSHSTEDKAKTVLKTSLAFLGVVGAASVVAHKYWPKGVLYGDKEEIATEKKKNSRRLEGTSHGQQRDDMPRGRRPQSTYDLDRYKGQDRLEESQRRAYQESDRYVDHRRFQGPRSSMDGYLSTREVESIQRVPRPRRYIVEDGPLYDDRETGRHDARPDGRDYF